MKNGLKRYRKQNSEKSFDDFLTKSKTSFIINDVGMLSFNKIMSLAVHLVQ